MTVFQTWSSSKLLRWDGQEVFPFFSLQFQVSKWHCVYYVFLMCILLAPQSGAHRRGAHGRGAYRDFPRTQLWFNQHIWSSIQKVPMTAPSGGSYDICAAICISDVVFSCPDRICGQLNRWHCHWLTHWPTFNILAMFSIHVCIKLSSGFFCVFQPSMVSVYLTIQSFYMCRKFSPHCLWQISSLIKTMTTMPQLSTAIPSQPSPSP